MPERKGRRSEVNSATRYQSTDDYLLMHLSIGYSLPRWVVSFLISHAQAPPTEQPKTIESTRERDETMVPNEDTEVQEELAMDEFSSYFKGDVVPKIAITTSRKPTKVDFLRKTTLRKSCSCSFCTENLRFHSQPSRLVPELRFLSAKKL